MINLLSYVVGVDGLLSQHFVVELGDIRQSSTTLSFTGWPISDLANQTHTTITRLAIPIPVQIGETRTYAIKPLGSLTVENRTA